MDTNFKQYDEICTTTYRELYGFAIQHDGQIIIKNFNPRDPLYKFVFAVARNLQALYNFKIILEISKIRILFKKKYRNVTAIKKIEDGIDVKTLVYHICEYYEQPSSIIEEIFNAYYKGMK